MASFLQTQTTAMVLLRPSNADGTEPRTLGDEDLDQPERTADATDPSDLLRPQANPNDDPIPHAAQAIAGPDKDPPEPSLWTVPSKAVGASWRRPIWDSGTDRSRRQACTRAASDRSAPIPRKS